MEPITTAALIGGGTALAQGLATSAFNMFGAQKQMDFQEKMSNTAHQREVLDLQAAGLNPILSANHSGAASPNMQAPASDAVSKVNSAMALRSQDASIGLIEAQTRNADATTANTVTNTQTAQQNQENDILLKRLAVQNSGMDFQTKKLALDQLDQQIAGIKLNNQALQYSLPGLRNDANFQNSRMGRAAPYADKSFDWFGEVLHGANSAKSLRR